MFHWADSVRRDSTTTIADHSEEVLLTKVDNLSRRYSHSIETAKDCTTDEWSSSKSMRSRQKPRLDDKHSMMKELNCLKYCFLNENIRVCIWVSEINTR